MPRAYNHANKDENIIYNYYMPGALMHADKNENV